MGMKRLKIIDSHTAGEPTRIVISGGPDLGEGTVAERLNVLRRKFDQFRSAIVNEPRGSDVIVGAALLQPADPSCVAGVIFFNNVGYLGMCGHGTIGLVATLVYLGRIKPGDHRIETPVGIVTATLHPNGEVSVANVPSWRAKKQVTAQVPGVGPVTGDVAWGGNWFFLAEKDGYESRRPTWHNSPISVGGFAKPSTPKASRRWIISSLFGPPTLPGAHSRNFVQCPGKAYDRSPCGTGTSAKLACLAADGKLAEGAAWVQESIIGSTFTARFRWLDRAAGKVAPVISGQAFVNAEATFLLDERDPFCWGIRV